MRKGTISIIATVLGAGVGAAVARKGVADKVDSWKQMSDKHLALFLMMNQWVKIKQEGKNLKDYFEKNNYKNIAIYGMSYAGEALVNELKNSDVSIKYGIDKNADGIYSDVDIVTMDDDLSEVDVVVVTPITFFDEIQRALADKIDCPIVSLEDILYGV